MHALQLAQDLRKYAPGILLIVLTDQTAEFENSSNVEAIQHQLQSIKGYHDKRFAVAAAIERFETCTFIDSDVRITAPINQERINNFPPGLTARFGCSVVKHNQGLSNKKKSTKSLSIIQDIATCHSLDIQEVNWLHEFMFTLRRQDDREQDFLRYWQNFSYYFELNGIYDGEGNTIGLAAAAAGLNFTFRRTDWFLIFKDCIVKEKIKNGGFQIKNVSNLFKEHQKIEYPSRSLSAKVSLRISRVIQIFNRHLQLRLRAILDSNFQRWLDKLKASKLTAE